MHILIIPSWYPNHINPINGIFFQEQARILKHQGHKVGIIAPTLWSTPVRLHKKNRLPLGLHYETEHGIPTFREYGNVWIHSQSQNTSRRWISAGQFLFEKYISEFGKPDIIQAHCAIHAGILADRLNKQYQIPYLITEHSSIFYRRKLSAWEFNLVSSAYMNAAARIAVSPTQGSFLENMFSDCFKPWSWIPNPLSDEFCNCPLASSKEKPFVFINFATLRPNKRQQDLLTAFAKAFKGNLDVHLKIGGAGQERKKLEKLSHRLGLNSQVTFLGQLNRQAVLDALCHANAFVLSSEIETFGIVVIEALACGLPVISTRCGGPECIINESNGILVEPRNTEQMAQAMKYMMVHYSDYHTHSIQKACLNNFAPAKIMSMYSDILKTI